MISTTVSIALLVAISQVDAAAQKDYADLLAKYVKNGRVDYKTLGEKDMSKLDRYVKAVGEAKIPSDKNAAIGMYIDAYNALVLKAVIDAGRPRSVLDQKEFFSGKNWTVAGRNVSLDELEKQVLNPYAKDPRTHMVLVCGAVGCPILEEKPYAGSNTDARMEAATKRYLAAPTGAVVEAGSLKLSKIFDWYKADFGGDAGVLAFVKQHLAKDAAAKLGDAPKVSFIDYNWTLNQQ
jgi:hypothetical protein